MIKGNEYSVSENYAQELYCQGIRNHLLDKQETVVDLNQLLKRNWRRFEHKGILKVAARLDPLPSVEGDEKKWHFVMNGLLSMIIKHPPKGFFFLHIKCDPVTTADTLNARLKRGFKNFQIHFKTNVTVNDNWYQLYNNKLQEIEITVAALKGSFAHNRGLDVGYLFSLTVPGKQD